MAALPAKLIVVDDVFAFRNGVLCEMTKTKPRHSARSATKQNTKGRLTLENLSPETPSGALEDLQELDKLERERTRFKDFIDANRDQPCIERSEKWLQFVLSNEFDSFGDQ